MSPNSNSDQCQSDYRDQEKESPTSCPAPQTQPQDGASPGDTGEVTNNVDPRPGREVTNSIVALSEAQPKDERKQTADKYS